jgi:hypothetical protein
LELNGSGGRLSGLCNEELNNLYTSLNIRLIKSRMRWVGHVARMGEMKLRSESPKEGAHSGDLEADGKIICGSFENSVGMCGLDASAG